MIRKSSAKSAGLEAGIGGKGLPGFPDFGKIWQIVEIPDGAEAPQKL
jgi:hypothetical protein